MSGARILVAVDALGPSLERVHCADSREIFLLARGALSEGRPARRGSARSTSTTCTPWPALSPAAASATSVSIDSVEVGIGGHCKVGRWSGCRVELAGDLPDSVGVGSYRLKIGEHEYEPGLRVRQFGPGFYGLASAAVLGRSFSADTLGAMMGVDQGRMARSLEMHRLRMQKLAWYQA